MRDVIGKCKVKPDTCMSCIDAQISYNQVLNCDECKKANEEYDLLDVKDSFWSGTQAIVCDSKGKISKVNADRITLLKR